MQLSVGRQWLKLLIAALRGQKQRIQDQPELQSKFQDSLGYTERETVLRNQERKQTKKKKKNNKKKKEKKKRKEKKEEKKKEEKKRKDDDSHRVTLLTKGPSDASKRAQASRYKEEVQTMVQWKTMIFS